MHAYWRAHARTQFEICTLYTSIHPSSYMLIIIVIKLYIFACFASYVCCAVLCAHSVCLWLNLFITLSRSAHFISPLCSCFYHVNELKFAVQNRQKHSNTTHSHTHKNWNTICTNQHAIPKSTTIRLQSKAEIWNQMSLAVVLVAFK